MAEQPHVAEALARSIRRSPDPGRALLALIWLDPVRAAAWLGREEKFARASLGGALPEALTTVFKLLLTYRAEEARTLFIRFSDLLAENAIVELAPLLIENGLSLELSSALRPFLERGEASAEALRMGAELFSEIGESKLSERCESGLGRSAPTMSTMRWLAARRAARPVAGETARIALLGSFTLDPLPWFLDYEVRELGLRPAIWTGGYNGWEREIADADSALYRFDPEIIFLSVALEDVVPDLDGMSEDRSRSAGDEAVERLAEAVETVAGRSGAMVVVHTFHASDLDAAGVGSDGGRTSRGAWVARLNDRLSDRLEPLPQVRLLEFAEVVLRRGTGPSSDSKRLHLARMRYTDAVSAELASAYSRIIAPLKGLTRKCVVLDLDNTIWGGVVGEEGTHGIRLGPTAPGSEFVDFQRYLRALSSRGFLLAIASKNNPEDALAVLRNHESMILREEDFSAIRIGWNPKPESLRSIASDLGIGVDSLVFIDDNPVERALMREALPEVLTPELPRDPARFREFVSRLPQLHLLTVTAEDRERAALYRARAKREQERAGAMSLDQYLHKLGIEARTALADRSALPRVHQLVQRTNQFNLTGRRYSLPELEALASSPNYRLYVTHARDRFGDHGQVGTAVVRLDSSKWRIECAVLSCRVIGQGVESALLSRIVRDSINESASAVEGTFVPSEKNAPAADFYPRHDFEPAACDGSGSTWRRPTDNGELAPPPWISIHHD